MSLKMFDPRIFDPSVFDVERVSSRPRGGDIGARIVIEKERIKRPQREDLQQLVREAYEALYEAKDESPVAAQAAEVIRPFVKKKTKAMPAPSRVDLLALANDLAAATKLLAIHEQHIRDEQNARVFMLLMH